MENKINKVCSNNIKENIYKLQDVINDLKADNNNEILIEVLKDMKIIEVMLNITKDMII